MKQKGLGRGLDAIFGTGAIDVKAKPMSHMTEIAIGDIVPNPTQPRKQFDEAERDAGGPQRQPVLRRYRHISVR